MESPAKMTKQGQKSGDKRNSIQMNTESFPDSRVKTIDLSLVQRSQRLRKRLLELGVKATVDFAEVFRSEEKAFGNLLALDLYDCPVEPLGSIEIGYHFLDRLAANLGMTTQSPPFIFLSDAKLFPDKAGLSGWVPLIQSGITLHTLIPTRFATIDVYSCSRVPPAETIAFTYEIFMPKRIEVTYLLRGRNYPAAKVVPSRGKKDD